jgi:hypothetical protein
VAEHDSAAQVLRFHDLPDEADVIAEPERDPRRPPYRDEKGLVGVRILHGFLRDEGAPALLVPMVAHGELQGYIVLTGDLAVQAHLEDPSRAQILGEELGLLLRSAQPAGGHAERREPTKLEHLMARARALAEQAHFLSGLTQALPIGVAWADELGRVRIVNKRLTALLAETGMAAPPHAAQSVLAPGAMTLADLIGALTGTEKVNLVRAMRGRGLSARISIGDQLIAHRLTVRAMRRKGPGTTPIAGYVVVLAPEEGVWSTGGPSDPPGGDRISALPASPDLLASPPHLLASHEESGPPATGKLAAA